MIISQISPRCWESAWKQRNTGSWSFILLEGCYPSVPENSPDLILMDVQLSEISGFEGDLRKLIGHLDLISPVDDVLRPWG